MTENEDQLHQLCNTDTLTRRDWDRVEKALSEAQTLLVLGIGLNAQPAKGFFHAFRGDDQEKRIIAVNMTDPDPCYLLETDYLLKGDLEEIIPQLKELLITPDE